MEKTRFDLEEQIMDCWGVVDDIKSLYYINDIRDLTEDERANALLGLVTVYQIKFELLFNTFEQLIQKGKVL
jgi:hypothetical protein